MPGVLGSLYVSGCTNKSILGSSLMSLLPPGREYCY